MRHIERFLEYASDKLLSNPHEMLVGHTYKITEPNYDDYNEGSESETCNVEVIKRMKHGFILRDIEHNQTFERTFQHLMDCKIENL